MFDQQTESTGVLGTALMLLVAVLWVATLAGRVGL